MINQVSISEIASRLEGNDLFASTESFEAKLLKTFRDVPFFSLFPEDQRFPEALRSLKLRDAVKGLVLAGNEALLNAELVGVCGSRHASDRALQVTHALCRELAESGIGIVSGYAAGVDERGHFAALEAGGGTVCVLAEGIGHFGVRKSLREVWDWSRALVLSQFGISSVWRGGRAMARNSTIVGISSATVVVEAKAQGGTINAGMTALRLGKPLFVVDFGATTESTEGNRLLLDQGAIAIRKSRTSGLPALGALTSLLAR